MSSQEYPVAVIGAGPVGLAAAAHLVVRGETPIVLEAGSEVGASVRQWAHVRMFSPWRYNMDKAALQLLAQTAWPAPDPDVLPTGGDLVTRYLQPLAETPALAPHIRLNTRVTAVSRRRIDKMKDAGRADAPFVLRLQSPDGEEVLLAKAVIDSSGTWHNPNPIGSDGLPAPGERTHADRIVYGIPDVLGNERRRYAGKRVAVIGGGHSAINALLELNELRKEAPATEIHWILRKGKVSQTYGGLSNDALPGRGLLGIRIKRMVEQGDLNVHNPFFVSRIEEDGTGVRISGDAPDGNAAVAVDEIIAATGARPDLEMLREVRLDLDPAVESPRVLAPLIDPNVHSCGTVRPHGEKELRQPESGFYIVGMKSYGRAPTFLLTTGYEQVRSVVAYLVGDEEAAADVQLELPETGVCGVPYAVDANEIGGNGCCGIPTADADREVAEVECGCGEPSTAGAAACCGPVGPNQKIVLIDGKKSEVAQATALPISRWA